MAPIFISLVTCLLFTFLSHETKLMVKFCQNRAECGSPLFSQDLLCESEQTGDTKRYVRVTINAPFWQCKIALVS